MTEKILSLILAAASVAIGFFSIIVDLPGATAPLKNPWAIFLAALCILWAGMYLGKTLEHK